MEHNPLISIIVPVYNAEKHISRCIESIVAQSYTKWELILVDDGSKDNSFSICNKYALNEKRISVIKQVNLGVSSARNNGLKLAEGEFVCFIDSDDSIHNKMLERLLDAQITVDADVVICGYSKISSEKNIKYEPEENLIQGSKQISEFIQENYLKWLIGSPWGKLYRNTDKVRKGFDENISLGEDLKFNVQLYCAVDRISVISDCLYLYYDVENSLTKIYKKGNYEAACNIYQTTVRELERINGLHEELIRNVNYKLFSFCISFMSQNINNTTLKEEYIFIKNMCKNPLLQSAIINLPEISLTRKVYANALKEKNTFILLILSIIKNIFID